MTSSFLSRTPIIIQYFFFLALNALATLAHHLTVRSLAFVLVPRRAPTPAGSERNNNVNVAEQSSASHNLPTPVYPASSGQHSSAANLSATSPSRVSHHESSPCLPGIATGTGASTTSGVTGNHAHSPPLPPPPPPPPLRRVSTASILNVQPLPPPAPASPTAISTALLVSSCAKLFPILLVIWGPDGSGGSSSGSNSNNGSISNSYAQSRANTQIGHTPSLLFARQQGTATPVATVVAQPTLQLMSSSPPSSSESWSMSSSFESWVARLVSTMPMSTPANQHLAGLLELIGSLLSLGAADTHLVLLSNIEALYILLGCGYLRAVALAVAGLIARWMVQRVILGAVGVG